MDLETYPYSDYHQECSEFIGKCDEMEDQDLAKNQTIDTKNLPSLLKMFYRFNSNLEKCKPIAKCPLRPKFTS